MGVEHENSAQMAAHAAIPPENNPVHEWRGRKRILYFKHTQVAAGDATSIQSLVKLPQGSVRVIAEESEVFHSAFGASRTLDLGYAAYTDLNGDAVVADPNFFATAKDVSAAGVIVADEAAADAGPSAVRYKLFESADGVEINSTVAGGTIPVGAVLEGVITYVLD